MRLCETYNLFTVYLSVYRYDRMRGRHCPALHADVVETADDLFQSIMNPARVAYHNPFGREFAPFPATNEQVVYIHYSHLNSLTRLANTIRLPDDRIIFIIVVGRSDRPRTGFVEVEPRFRNYLENFTDQ